MKREHLRDADFARASPAPAPVPADAAIAANAVATTVVAIIIAAAAADPDLAADVAAVTALLHPFAATAAYLIASMKIPPLS
ncbi:hypothetical protein P5V15_010772 [Pogonomyrmex californicus]